MKSMKTDLILRPKRGCKLPLSGDVSQRIFESIFPALKKTLAQAAWNQREVMCE